MPGNAGDIRAGRAYVELGADSSELEAKVKGGMGLLKQLKQGVGSRSEFKDVIEIFKGAGAVAGLGLAARSLNDMAQGAVKWRDAMNQGGAAAAGATEEMLQSLPVLGQIRQAGLAIQELFTGEQAAAKAIREEADLLNKSMDARLKLQKAITAATEDQAEAMRKLIDRQGLTGLHPEDRTRVEAQQKLAADRKERQAKVDQGKTAIQSETAATIGPIRESIGKLESRREAVRDELTTAFASDAVKRGTIERLEEELSQIESNIEAHNTRIQSVHEQSKKALADIDANAKREALAAEETHFREMIDKEKKVNAERAEENRRAAEQIAKEQADVQREAQEAATRRAQEGMERQAEQISKNRSLRDAAENIGEILTFGLTGDLTKIKDAVADVAKTSGMGKSPFSSVGTTQFGVAESMSAGTTKEVRETNRILKRMERGGGLKYR